MEWRTKVPDERNLLKNVQEKRHWKSMREYEKEKKVGEFDLQMYRESKN